jgi:hypothetical protein
MSQQEQKAEVKIDGFRQIFPKITRVIKNGETKDDKEE